MDITAFDERSKSRTKGFFNGRDRAVYDVLHQFITGWICLNGLRCIRVWSHSFCQRSLTRQGCDTGEFLSFEKLEGCSTTGRDVAELILDLVLGSNSCGIATANDNNLSVLCGINCGIESCFRTLGK